MYSPMERLRIISFNIKTFRNLFLNDFKNSTNNLVTIWYMGALMKCMTFHVQLLNN